MENTEIYTLSEIWIYPVKSLGGIQLKEAIAEEKGLKYDRRWMIIDENNRFLSQRELPEMALIQVGIEMEGGELHSLIFYHKLKRIAPYVLKKPTEKKADSVTLTTTIWDDTVLAHTLNTEVDEWLSNRLSIKCQLVYMPEVVKRNVDPRYAILGNEITSFSDAYPYLILGNASMELLNSKLENKILPNRFRANLIFEGGYAHDEDAWEKIKIGNASFDGVKLCARCQVPTIEQETAQKGKEPTKTLANYRSKNNKIYFGQNLLISTCGRVKVGDPIKVITIDESKKI